MRELGIINNKHGSAFHINTNTKNMTLGSHIFMKMFSYKIKNKKSIFVFSFFVGVLIINARRFFDQFELKSFNYRYDYSETIFIAAI
jgi:hypothetical protein